MLTIGEECSEEFSCNAGNIRAFTYSINQPINRSIDSSFIQSANQNTHLPENPCNKFSAWQTLFQHKIN